MSDWRCPACGLPLALKKDRDSVHFWGCTNIKGCGFTWPGTPEGPQATTIYEGLKMPALFEGLQEQARRAIGALFPEYNFWLSQVMEAECLLELGRIRGELLEIKQARRKEGA